MTKIYYKISCNFFQRFYVVKGFRFYWKLHVVFQNHNISVINKNGRVYQEFIFFMSPCDLMALLKKLYEEKIDCALNPFTCP